MGRLSGTGSFQNCYNAGEIQTNTGTRTYISGAVGLNSNTTGDGSINVYNIGKISTNATAIGGLVAYREDPMAGWTNYFWLENMGATYAEGNLTNVYGKASSSAIKALVSNSTFDNTIWTTNSSINNGYPYLKAFDDTTIWLRNSAINDGEPYLKDNPPVK